VASTAAELQRGFWMCEWPLKHQHTLSRIDRATQGCNSLLTCRVGSAWEVSRRWRKPFLTASSDSDPITHGFDSFLQQAIPGAQGQPHTTIAGAGHFLQEDKGEELARVVLDFIARTPA
jgi:pimeloyl-ACP methyl ester carboxylesterase